jgi:hypothetical protein
MGLVVRGRGRGQDSAAAREEEGEEDAEVEQVAVRQSIAFLPFDVASRPRFWKQSLSSLFRASSDENYREGKE